MALIHQATLTPSKISLLTTWLPSQSWFSPKAVTGEGQLPIAEVRQLGAYRFDDPAGQVGLEAFLLQTSDGSVVHVPMTYRAEPLAGAQEYLVGTTEHSVLGQRWVYDACGDPVWAAALATAILTGGTQAEEVVDKDGRLEPRTPTATVSGSGTPGTHVGEIHSVTCHQEGPTAVIRANELELVIVRVLGAEVAATHTLTGRWGGGGPAVLAGVRAI